jgi:hypothetical protein
MTSLSYPDRVILRTSFTNSSLKTPNLIPLSNMKWTEWKCSREIYKIPIRLALWEASSAGGFILQWEILVLYWYKNVCP